MSAALDTVRGAAVSLGAGAKAGPVGLVLDDGLSFDDWSLVGEQIGRVANASAWWVGDWVNYGFWEFGEKYEEAIERTGLAYQTLRNIASVCEAFALSRRRDNLSFGHHEAAAGLDQVGQELALDRAQREGLSVMALRNVVRGMRELPARAAFPIRFSIDLPPTQQQRAERWRQAAEASGMGFVDWAADALDKAAA